MLKNKILTSLVMVALALPAFAQKNNVQTAYNMLKSNRLAEAKTAIDQAAENETTSNDLKMWYYRGKIYYEIARLKKTDIDPDAMSKAAEGLMRCIDVDDKARYKEEVHKLLMSTAGMMNNAGIDEYNAENYDGAEKTWMSILGVLPYANKLEQVQLNLDTATVYNNCLSAALKAGQKDKAKEYITTLIAMKPDNLLGLYIDLSNLYIEDKDMDGALKVVEDGLKEFPSDKLLGQQMVFLYFNLNRTDDLLAKLNKNLESNPNDAGSIYLRGKIMESKEELTKAETDISKAAELSPEVFDYWYDLGVVQYNLGASTINSANNIKDNKKYEAKKAEGNAKIKAAASSFEKAKDIKPEDLDVLNQLKQVYIRTNENVKYDAVVAKLKELESK
ncbi:MAG: hypothetical protein H6585_06640 [Flavobacteriales bacterium]|nr:hypothetical protein [Flavobacteriales bacterium]MCB9448007.1 hypothetical protein [Flavobacteriales bacterium]